MWNFIMLLVVIVILFPSMEEGTISRLIAAQGRKIALDLIVDIVFLIVKIAARIAKPKDYI